MTPMPTVLGLTLCEKAIVEQGTNNISLISTFTRLVVEGFRSQPQKFALFTTLTQGRGDGILDVVIRHLESNVEVQTAQLPIRFSDPIAEVRVLVRIHRCIFRSAGEYLCVLMLDGEWLAQRRLQVVERSD